MGERLNMLGGECTCGCCGPVPESDDQEREALREHKERIERRLAELERA